MQITAREEGAVTVVEFEGHLDTNTAREAQEHLDGLQDGGVQKILVSFEKLDYISSAGLRVLLVMEGVLDPTQVAVAADYLDLALSNSGTETASMANSILEDPDLDSVRDLPDFEEIVSRARAVAQEAGSDRR